MSEHKRDPSLGKRHLKNFILLGIPFALAWVAAFYALRHQRIDWFITFFVAGLGIAIVGLLRQERLFRNYRCPQCGTRLPESPRKDRKPIEFFCSRCDIIWDSGFIESDNGG